MRCRLVAGDVLKMGRARAVVALGGNLTGCLPCPDDALHSGALGADETLCAKREKAAGRRALTGPADALDMFFEQAHKFSRKTDLIR